MIVFKDFTNQWDLPYFNLKLLKSLQVGVEQQLIIVIVLTEEFQKAKCVDEEN